MEKQTARGRWRGVDGKAEVDYMLDRWRENGRTGGGERKSGGEIEKMREKDK